MLVDIDGEFRVWRGYDHPPIHWCFKDLGTWLLSKTVDRGVGTLERPEIGIMAVPTAKNSMTFELQPWVYICRCMPTMPLACNLCASFFMRPIASWRAE